MYSGINKKVLYGKERANKACSRLVGFVPTYKHFSGFGLFLPSKRISSRPPAANANRWLARCEISTLKTISLRDIIGA
jgi:hypothetical protein